MYVHGCKYNTHIGELNEKVFFSELHSTIIQKGNFVSESYVSIDLRERRMLFVTWEATFYMWLHLTNHSFSLL